MTAAGHFALRHPAEIAELLERLWREKVPVTVDFDGRAIVSRVLDVRRDARTMIFDVAQDPETNRRLFATLSLAFTTELDHVPILFQASTPLRMTFLGGPAAVTALPDTMARLQRREWFRAPMPSRPPVRCVVVDRVGHASETQAIDLSGGGAAVVADDPALLHAKPGSDHALILSVPDVGRLELEATLRTVRPGSGLGDAALSCSRLGFRFEGVSPKIANHLQRYVQRLEVEHRRDR